jgi:hypothetical protein
MQYSAWYPVAFLVVALVASLAVAIARGLRMWRSFRAFSGSAGAAMSAVTTAAEQAETHAVAFAAATERLERAQVRLQQSLAEFAVLRAAADEVRATVAGVRGIVPRKGQA